MFLHCRTHLRGAFLVAAFGALLASVVPSEPAAQSRDKSVCDIQTSERVVAVGDAHGAYDQFVAILRSTGLIDRRNRWSGGRSVLVQTGDVLDRGPDSREILDLLRRLERDASRAGGRVYFLLGNHEVMRMIQDWRYVSPEEYADFRTLDSVELRERVYAIASVQAEERARAEQRPHDAREFRERFFEEIPLGFIEMREAFNAAGDYGRWLREHHAVIKINGILFVHGGIDGGTAAMGCEEINEAVRRDLAIENPTLEQAIAMFSSSPTGSLWYRGLAEEPEDNFEPWVTGILRAIDAHAIVIGHTPTPNPRIRTRFDGRVIQIDTGMLDGEHFPGGVASALEIQGDVLTAIYEEGRERLAAARPSGPSRRRVAQCFGGTPPNTRASPGTP